MKPQKKIDIENSLNDVKKIKKRFKELLLQKAFLVEALNNIEKLSIGIDTSLMNINQRNTIALIYQNCINTKQSIEKAGE